MVHIKSIAGPLLLPNSCKRTIKAIAEPIQNQAEIDQP